MTLLNAWRGRRGGQEEEGARRGEEDDERSEEEEGSKEGEGKGEEGASETNRGTKVVDCFRASVPRSISISVKCHFPYIRRRPISAREDALAPPFWLIPGRDGQSARVSD